MNIVRYEPWTALRRFQNDVNRMVHNVGYQADGPGAMTSAWVPAADVREEADRFVICADVPGVDPEGIEITMDAGVLTIKGERTGEAEDGARHYQRIERSSGTFERRFSLPESANSEAVSAKGRNGVLEISIPKHEKLQPRRIQVN